MKEIKKRKPKEKSLSAFAKSAVIYAVSLAALFAVLIGVLAAFLYTYEKNLPEKVAESFVSKLGRDGLALLVKKTVGEIGEFENAELLIDRTEHLSGKIKQAKLAKEYTSEAPVYRLICGGSDIGKLTLKRAEKNAAFGITRFEVDKVSLYKESVPGALERTAVRVCVPFGAVLRVNGKEAGEDWISERSVRYTGSTVTMEGTLCDIYFIDGLCLVPELQAELDGVKSSMSITSGKADWFSEKERSFILTVPSDADVSIGGKAPSEAIASRGELTEAVNEFEKHLGEDLPKTLSYTVYGSAKNTEISVSVNGQELEEKCFDDEKKIIYLYSDESKFNVSAVIPKDAELYINGIKVSDAYYVGEKEYEGLSGIKYLSSTPEAMCGKLYEINGFLCEPSITARIGESELSICSFSKNGQTFNAEFYGRSMENNYEAVKEAADNFTRTYFHYVASGAVGIEENYNALTKLMKNGSPGYKQIQRSKSSFEFVNQGVYRIDLISPKNFISIGDKIMCCQVDYSVNLRFYRNEKLYEGTFFLAFIKENDSYLVCDMVIDSEG